jgi:hypothetical protein
VHNPYAPPQAPVSERHASRAGICRDRSLLHLQPEAMLPDHCVLCTGSSEIERLRFTRHWTRPLHATLLWLAALMPWLALPLLMSEPGGFWERAYPPLIMSCNPVTALLAMVLIRKRQVLELPLCGNHARQRSRLRAALLAVAVLLLLASGALLWPPDQHHPALHYTLSMGAIALMAVSGIARERLFRLPRLARVAGDGSYHLKGLRPDFLALFDDCREAEADSTT